MNAVYNFQIRSILLIDSGVNQMGGSATLNRTWLRNQVFRLKSGQINLFEPDPGRSLLNFRKNLVSSSRPRFNAELPDGKIEDFLDNYLGGSPTGKIRWNLLPGQFSGS